jgi:hypothetical protein
MSFITPDPSNLTYDPYLGAIRMADLGYGTFNNPLPVGGIYVYDTSGVLWVFTVDTSGAWVSTKYVAPTTTGQSVGIFPLTITYS